MLPRCLLSANKPNTWDGWMAMGFSGGRGIYRNKKDHNKLKDKLKDIDR